MLGSLGLAMFSRFATLGPDDLPSMLRPGLWSGLVETGTSQKREGGRGPSRSLTETLGRSPTESWVDSATMGRRPAKCYR
jgi:hypothetical protein